MKLSPINNYSQNNKQKNASFKGTVDKAIYSIVEAKKQKLRRLYENNKITKLVAHDATARQNRIIDGLNKIAEKLHPAT